MRLGEGAELQAELDVGGGVRVVAFGGLGELFPEGFGGAGARLVAREDGYLGVAREEGGLERGAHRRGVGRGRCGEEMLGEGALEGAEVFVEGGATGGGEDVFVEGALEG